jgi:hypothetical protein
MILIDALPSPGLNPLEGPTMLSCGKLGLRRRSRLPALGGVEGRARSPEIRLGRDQAIWSRTCIQNQRELVRSHSAYIWCWDKPRANSDSHDTPRPGLEGSHHLPPYSILCSSPSRLHPNGYFSRDSQVGVSKLSRLESRDFGSSYLPTAESDQDEVWTKVIALFQSFPTLCRTPDSDVGKRSILDF